MAITKDEIIKALEGMKLTELNDLVKAIESHFGVTASAPMMVAGNADQAKSEGPTEVSVIVTNAGAAKVAVIKIVGQLTGKGLMDAKKIVEAVPAIIKEKIKPEEAEEIKKQLVEAGATVEIK